MRERRDGPRFEALDADLFAGLEAVAVAAVFDALQRLVDLADQLALAIAGAQLEAEFLFLRGAVVRDPGSSPLRPSCARRCGRLPPSGPASSLRILRKCSSCSLLMYCSPRLAMYGGTLRGPASRLPGSSARLRHRRRGAARAVAAMPTARTAHRSRSRRCARTAAACGSPAPRAWQLRGAGSAAGAGLRRRRALRSGGLGGLRTGALAGAVSRRFGCDGLRRRLLCGQPWFLGFLGLGWLCSRFLAGIWSLQARIRKGAGLQDAGLYRPTFACTAA